MHSNKSIQFITPTIPMYAVYYLEDTDDVFTEPILCFEAREYRDRDEPCADYLPISLNPCEGAFRCKDMDNFIGYCLHVIVPAPERKLLLDNYLRKKKLREEPESKENDKLPNGVH